MDVVTLQAALVTARKQQRYLSPALISSMGDSITKDGAFAGGSFGATNYLAQAVLASKGKLQMGGVYATAGFRTDQILATHLPQVLAASPKPHFCVVHAATNDMNTVLTAQQTRDNLTAIYRGLMAKGITPVLTTMLPRHGFTGTSRGQLEQVSMFIMRFARDNGLPLVDFTTPFTDPTNSDWLGYASNTWNYDDTHPNHSGYKAMGKAIANALSPLLLTPPLVAMTQSMPGGRAPSASNALLLTDTNANGRPNTWDFSNAPSGSAYALVPYSAGNGLGNYYRVTFGATSLAANADSFAVTPGNRMLMSMRIETTGVLTSATNIYVFLGTTDGTTQVAGMRFWTEDIDAGSVWTQEFVVPTGLSTNNLQLFISTDTKTGASGTISIGQVAIIDLTAAGLA